MLVNTVPKESMTPYLRTVADELYPQMPQDFLPHFERYFGMLANAPEHAERLFPYYLGIWFENSIGPRLTEMMRLAIANGTQCPLCLNVRYSDEVTEADVAAIPDQQAASLSPRERAALRFASAFGGDHHAIGAEHFKELEEHFSDRQITEIMLFCALALGLGRILKVTEIVDAACPLPASTGVRSGG